MPTYRGPRRPQARSQDLIRRIYGEVLPRAGVRLDRSEERMNRSVTRELESTHRILDPARVSRRLFGGHDTK